MRIGRIGYGIRGFYRSADYALRMDTTSKDAQVRAKILKFWKHYGLDATLAAFGVSRRTLHRWQDLRQIQGGNLTSLANQSRAPKQRRQRNWPDEVNAEIKRLRTRYPNLGRDKILPLLSLFCSQSVGTHHWPVDWRCTGQDALHPYPTVRYGQAQTIT